MMIKKRDVVIALLLSFFYTIAADLNITFHDSGTCPSSYYYIFSHGIQATGLQAFNFQPILKYPHNHYYWLLQEPFVTFNFNDAISDKTFHYHLLNLGQEADLQALNTVIHEVSAHNSSAKKILIGLSRGAVTIFNYVALYNPTDVAALVLESPFDTFTSVLKHFLGPAYLMSGLCNKIAYSVFPALNKKGPFPSQLVNQIPLNLPIIFIHSKKDSLVPINSSRNLYIALRRRGHEHVYLVELASGKHGHLLEGKDYYYYYSMVHCFYKKYGLPHDETAVKYSEHLFAQCQPTVENVLKRMKK